MALMLCAVKVTNATNDNFAAVVYNYMGLEFYFLIGFGLTIVSLLSALALGFFIESVQNS